MHILPARASLSSVNNRSRHNLQSSNRFSMTNEAHLTALGSIGLSQYESKCFLASLELGPSTINQIGITAGVPRTKVYGSVKKLVERGLIEQSEEDQKIFIARSPRDFLIPLLEKESRRIKESLDAMTELEVIHESMEYVKKAETLRSKVWRYSPRKAVQSLIEIENCKISFLPASVPIQIITIDSQYLIITELKPDDLKEEGMDVAFMIQNSELGEMMESLIRIIGPQILGEKINKILT